MGFFRSSKDWQGHFEEGMRHGSAADFSSAEKSFREAVRLAPDEPYPHYELGYTLALGGRYEEALDELRRTQELRRAFFAVETEIWICEQALSGSLDADVIQKLRDLQWMVDAGGAQSEDAVAISSNVVQEAPECALGHFHFGKAIFERDPAGAEEALRRCLELEPDDTTAINAKWHLGKLREQAGHKDEARQIWSAIGTDHRGHPAAELAQKFTALGR